MENQCMLCNDAVWAASDLDVPVSRSAVWNAVLGRSGSSDRDRGGTFRWIWHYPTLYGCTKPLLSPLEMDSFSGM
ncbi:hypothetical protein PISMIDRAFT_681228 [Pisolithus microcarpus 441]|uniref:Unplaced genomic scaffold scaffold_67, whole genome shotgun sequence n=1 Tax=Pisolithus microcarpus 441 TaxID=765257 RepID=A0A0C9ZP70_9AGAM|nr:hypothetical protein PISMIDRAFT_681228 [Pisolithus microcarpus 441]